MPSTGQAISRRNALLGAAAIALVGATASACGAQTPQPVIDDLVAQRDMAQKDSDLAAAAAKAAGPDYATALNVVMAERAAHAKALAAEIARAAGPTGSSTSSPTPSSPVSAAPGPAPTVPAPPPSVADVTAALRNSADSATQLAAKLSGYRAGLLGSIAASCIAALAVPLAAKKPTT